MSDQPTALSRYEKLSNDREPYITRAVDCAKVTIPALFPRRGTNGATTLATPWQGYGARILNNLAAKYLMVLLPSNGAFFRYVVIDPKVQAELGQNTALATEIDKALVSVETAINTEIETRAIRPPALEMMKQLILSGNVLCYFPDQGGMRIFRLDKYVVKRSPDGTPVEIILKECLDTRVLPVAIQRILEEDTGSPKDEPKGNHPSDKPSDNTIDVYTRVYLKNNLGEKPHWVVYQEVKGIVIPGSEGSYPVDKCPWLPLRFTRVDGEDYGRGYVEEYLGDIQTLDLLSKAITEGSVAAAKVIFLVSPNGSTRIRTLAEAKSGDIKTGHKDDVTCLQMDKAADFSIARNLIDDIKQQLGMAFLLNTSIQRNGERVTAEEIRYMASELETALGGSYAVLSQEWQLPLVTLIAHQLEKQDKLPALPKEVVRPAVVTGIEALGRGHDLQKLDTFVAGLLQNLGPDGVKYLNVSEYLARRANALGVDSTGLVKAPEQLAAEQQQAMQAQMMQQAISPGINAVGGIAKEAMNGSNNGSGTQVAPAGA